MSTTKLTIDTDGYKFIVELPKAELSPQEMFDMFRSLFLGCTFTYEQWEQQLINSLENL